ncbi:hypothetical protein E2C01_023333 [Portunus trituberculatus]|uniref:Uncharacterized protein n=1 Tax=Portunus trituberculatus TaxID=210409 RepID=A0A5B7E8J5_PORTR|nr:hypothetical protein [Portunus trituberculatus]
MHAFLGSCRMRRDGVVEAKFGAATTTAATTTTPTVATTLSTTTKTSITTVATKGPKVDITSALPDPCHRIRHYHIAILSAIPSTRWGETLLIPPHPPPPYSPYHHTHSHPTET